MITSQPKVSFIIPYYNSGITIQETINSIFSQTYTNFDIWIIDDGSTDNLSIEKLKKFEDNSKINIIYQGNLGPSIARNRAIELVESEFIIPLDSDDLILSNAIELALPIFGKDKNIAVVYGDYLLRENDIDKFCQQNPINPKRMLIYNSIPFCSIIRVSAYKEIGGLDEWLSKRGLEDWEFWIQLLQSKWRFYYLNRTLFKINKIQNSRTFKVANKNIDIIKEYIYKKHSNFLFQQYHELYYLQKQTLETPDYRIGNFLLKPYRFLKRIFSKEQ